MRWFNTSRYLQRRIQYEDGYFFPRGRRDLVTQRARREATSRALLNELSAPLQLVTRMPFVRLVALSGSLAHLNADHGADVDLFVVTRPHRVWTTTVMILAVARLLGWRKRLCLNYVISERALWIAPADLFSANQIVHLQPLAGKATYHRFLEANAFVMRFYPNFVPRPVTDPPPRPLSWLESLAHFTIGPLLEPLCRFVYRAHLRRRSATWQSRDQVRLEPECLKLHTRSHRREVMERFDRALDRAATVPIGRSRLIREEAPHSQAAR
jgi:hypothetical protein